MKDINFVITNEGKEVSCDIIDVTSEATTDVITSAGETTDGISTAGETTDGMSTAGETTDGMSNAYETTDGMNNAGEITDRMSTAGETIDAESGPMQEETTTVDLDGLTDVVSDSKSSRGFSFGVRVFDLEFLVSFFLFQFNP